MCMIPSHLMANFMGYIINIKESPVGFDLPVIPLPLSQVQTQPIQPALPPPSVLIMPYVIVGISNIRFTTCVLLLYSPSRVRFRIIIHYIKVRHKLIRDSNSLS
jgi:hypothetical protein